MALVKSPVLTLAKLEANRANALKSTGPRTHRGKARVTLNALKHGRHASKLFRTHLLQNRADVALYDWMYARICDALQPSAKPEWRHAEWLARRAWCVVRSARRQGLEEGLQPSGRGSVWCLFRVPTCFTGGFRTKPRYAVKSTDACVTFPIRHSGARNGNPAEVLDAEREAVAAAARRNLPAACAPTPPRREGLDRGQDPGKGQRTRPNRLAGGARLVAEGRRHCELALG